MGNHQIFIPLLFWYNTDASDALHNLSLDPKTKALAPDSENKVFVFMCITVSFAQMCCTISLMFDKSNF